jgi:hypothetical protein
MMPKQPTARQHLRGVIEQLWACVEGDADPTGDLAKIARDLERTERAYARLTWHRIWLNARWLMNDRQWAPDARRTAFYLLIPNYAGEWLG